MQQLHSHNLKANRGGVNRVPQLLSGVPFTFCSFVCVGGGDYKGSSLKKRGDRLQNFGHIASKNGAAGAV